MTVTTPLWSSEDDVYQARLAEARRRAERATSAESTRLADRMAELRVANPEPLSRMGPRTLGDFTLVEVGCEVYGKADGPLADIRLGPDGEPRGGVVLEIVDARQVDEDGAITFLRAFRVFDPMMPGRLAYSTLTEAQVDPTRFGAPNPSRLAGLIRRWAKQVGAGKGILTSSEAQSLLDASRLAAILMQRGY